MTIGKQLLTLQSSLLLPTPTFLELPNNGGSNQLYNDRNYTHINNPSYHRRLQSSTLCTVYLMMLSTVGTDVGINKYELENMEGSGHDSI